MPFPVSGRWTACCVFCTWHERLTVKHLMTALRITLVLTVLTGVIYPLAVLGVAQALFPREANGSLLPGNVGSRLIGQSFAKPQYFHPRPSATATTRPVPAAATWP